VKDDKVEIQKNVALNNKNWFKTGGPAAFYAEPANAQAFADALAYAQNNDLSVFILGKGANILISDRGFDGLVIRPTLKEINHTDIGKTDVLVTAQAGVSIAELIIYCLEHNTIGLEEFSGIPGSVGGAVCMNIHYFQHSLRDFLVEATVINRNTQKIENVDKNWLELGYDKSRLMDKKYFLVSATFKLKKATDIETAYASGRRAEILRHSNSRYPTKNTCGCFFKYFSPDEVTITIPGTDKKMIYVAYYLDKIGVKGNLTVGDAVVSHQHANMIVNKGYATSEDIVLLAREMQKLVKEHFGIIPQPECQLVGFDEYPLLRYKK